MYFLIPVASVLAHCDVTCVTIIEEYRPHSDISPTNEYFFAQGDAYFRGSDVIRPVCNEMNISNITSRNLRKNLATMLHVMSLPKSHLERLAEFMGHSLDVHENFYRLSNDIQDKAKITKLFLCPSKYKVPQ